MSILPQNIVDGLSTKSAKIRALNAAGFSRTEIAAFLKIRYQHVRNVLVQSSTPESRPTVAKTVRPPPAERQLWHMQQLIDAGFQLIAECHTLGPSSFQYSATAPTSAGVYAFAVDGWVYYIGLTRNGLRTRLGHYVYGHVGQKTSARVKALIIGALAEHKQVSVLIAQPPQLEWNGLPVDGSAGLETGLIALLRPPWNQQGAS